MNPSKINRRNWLKTSALTAGGIMASPYLGFSKNPSLPLQLDADGNAIYSPFFKEYLPEDAREFPVFEA